MPGFSTIVIPVSDLAAATKVYAAALGAQPHTDTPYYVGFNVDGCELALAPMGSGSDQPGPVAYVDHPDAAKAVADLVAAGASVVQEPTEVGDGAVVAVLADPDGNRFGVRAPH